MSLVTITKAVQLTHKCKQFRLLYTHTLMATLARWGVGSRHRRSRVRLPDVPLSRNNLGQVAHTHVPLSPSSIVWYQSNGGDALRLGR